MAYKKGRLTLDEIQYIEENVTNKNYIEIAEHLERKPTTIKDYIKGMGYHPTLYESTPTMDKNPIEKKEFWPSLQQMFSPYELQVFVTHWNSMQHQFNYDVLPTEEMQIVDMIKLELLSLRSLRAQKDAETHINMLNIELGQQSKLTPTEVAAIKDSQNSCRIAISKFAQEYLQVQDRKTKLMQELKGTRAARIKEVSSDKKNFIHWVENILSNPDVRRSLGIEMEKFRLSMIDEEVRLAAYNKYENGAIDQPLLNSTTAKDDNGI